MTTSKRLTERKVAKFEKSVTKRRVTRSFISQVFGYPVGHIVLGFLVFVVLGLSLFLVFRMATTGSMA